MFFVRIRAAICLTVLAVFASSCADTISDFQVSETASAAASPQPTTQASPDPTATQQASSATALPAAPTPTPNPTPRPGPTAIPTPIPQPDNGSPDSPLPLAGSSFSYESFLGATWNVELDGLIETPLHQWNDSAGTCLVLIGTVTPTNIDSGLVTSGFDAPTFGALADGQYLDDSVNDCNTDQLDATGYGWILDAEVTLNTPYPFRTEFFLPEGTTIQTIVIGQPTDNNAAYLSPDIITTIPTAQQTTGSTATEVLPLAGSSFSYDSFLGATWNVELDGLIETPLHQWNDSAGTCLVLIGTVTPTNIDSGLVTSGFDAPTFGALADGQYLDDSVNDCNTDQLDATGYGWILDAEVTLNTPYPFRTEFFLPEGTTIQTIVIGQPTDNNAAYLSPDIITTIPTP